ncbi:MAG TPA: choice-of-anchor tandem repeat GloVer-containing protein [Chthonomonadaceae bacterium]|nr:choice-of-anchor tandem repeat GloVer-containing protein [Chthonomonadaceae bacterium]
MLTLRKDVVAFAVLFLVAGLLPAIAQSRQSTNTVRSFAGHGADTNDYGYDSQSGGDSAHEITSLVQGPGGAFYGTSMTFNSVIHSLPQNQSYVDNYYTGTVFKVAPDGTASRLYSFEGPIDTGPLGLHTSSTPRGIVPGYDGYFYGITAYDGAHFNGTFFRISPGGTLETLHSFTEAEGIQNSPGTLQLARGLDGSFYGTAPAGGAHGHGTVFKITSGGSVTVLHSFDGSDGDMPLGGLVLGRDLAFYGTTAQGGDNGLGTVFKITSGGLFTPLHSFNGSDGAGPFTALTQDKNGNLYGTTGNGGTADVVPGGARGYGTVFKITPTGTLTPLHIFTAPASNKTNPDGVFPNTLTRGRDGNFYGVTGGGGLFASGVVFAITPSGDFTTLYSFLAKNPDNTNYDGANPRLIAQGSDGNLYGATSYGGTSGFGVVFQLAQMVRLDVLHDFTNTDGITPLGIVEANDGLFYGTAYSSNQGVGFGTVFKITRAGALTVLHTFGYARPNGGLIQAQDGDFYGTTGGDVAGNYLYRITPTGNFTDIFDFSTGVEGRHPVAGVIQGSDGALYGTTYDSGTTGGGTVFRRDASGTVTPLHAFTGDEGYAPTASLLQASDGLFYGTTSRGGIEANSGYGSVFRITATGDFKVLHRFDPSKEQLHPICGLTEGRDGSLYGVTQGIYGGGAIFKLQKDDGSNADTLQTVHNFNNNEGANPSASLLQASDGNLYGLLSAGGSTISGGVGAIFKVTPTGGFMILYRFSGLDGNWPYSAPLIEGSDGYLYGVTGGGGAYGNGVFFRLDVGLPKKRGASPISAGPIRTPRGH